MSSATSCVVCGREMGDTAYACTGCSGKAAANLATIADMTPAARDVAHGFSNRGGGGGGSGKPGSRLPLDLGATSKLDAVQNALTTLARDIAETRGIRLGSDSPSGRLSLAQSAQNGSGVHCPTPERPEAAETKGDSA